MATSKKQPKSKVLNLIGFKGHLYPSDTEDYHYLRSRGVTSYRLPVSSLGFLKKTRFVNADVNIVPITEMWTPFMEHLLTELATFGEVTESGSHSATVFLDTSSLEATTKYLRRVGVFTSRYCIKASLDSKSRKSDGKSLLKVTFTYNEDINNSYAFVNPHKASKELASADEPFVDVLLAESVKLRLVRSAVNGTPTLQVVVLDKAGDSWTEALNRSGSASKISKDSLEKAGMFLLEMS